MAFPCDFCRCGWLTLVCLLASAAANPIPNADSQAVPLYLTSSACGESLGCAGHSLQCGLGSSLVILEATHGFHPLQFLEDLECGAAAVSGDLACGSLCCSYNQTSDCQEMFTSEELVLLRRLCSNKQSCNFSVAARNASVCSSPGMAPVAFFSTIRAVCVPESSTLHPCSEEAVVSGQMVSIRSPDPEDPTSSSPPSSRTPGCRCRLDTNATTNDPVNLTVTQLNIPTVADITLTLQTLTGSEPTILHWNVSALFSQFSQSVMMSFPLTLTFDPGMASLPELWMAFEVESLHLTLSCGQDSEPIETTSLQKSIEQSTGDPSDTNNDIRRTSVYRTRTAITEATARKDTTNLIIYALIGVAALFALSFVYVCAKKIRKRGCPAWCPPVCQQLQCGKTSADSHTSGHSDTSNDISTVSTNQVLLGRGKHTNGFHMKTRSGAILTVNGHVINGSDDEENPHLSPAPRLVPIDMKRRRSSLQSLRRASFSNLENITETEEESRFPARHHNPSSLNLQEQVQIFQKVGSTLDPLALLDDDSASFNEEEKDSKPELKPGDVQNKNEITSNNNNNDNTIANNNYNTINNNSIDERSNAAHTGSRVSQDQTRPGETRAEREEKGDACVEDEEVEEDRPRVRFSLGSDSSDPDLEHHHDLKL